MSSGFVTEKEAAEARQRRQEEWERVRTADQPLERPEEPYDGRSLYDRLKEQKVKKDMEYEEAHKLKNLIRGLDDDEVQFLELVDQNKIDAEKKQMEEEQQELKEFRNRVATLQQESEDKKLQSELKTAKAKPSTVGRPSQKSLMAIGIKRKLCEPSNSSSTNIADSSSEIVAKCARTAEHTTAEGLCDNNINTNEYDVGQLKCVAVLPGIGRYEDSSDSELSSGSAEDVDTSAKYDLVGRTRQKKKSCQNF